MRLAGDAVEVDHARTLGGSFSMQVEQDAGRHVVGGNGVIPDHPPDQRRLGGEGVVTGGADGARSAARSPGR